jgi:hypothetical protein
MPDKDEPALQDVPGVGAVPTDVPAAYERFWPYRLMRAAGQEAFQQAQNLATLPGDVGQGFVRVGTPEYYERAAQAAETMTGMPGGAGGLGSGARLAARKAAPKIGEYAQYAEHYPPTGPAQSMVFKDTGKVGPAKQLTPEAKAFDKARKKIMADMKKYGYTPYYDPAKRFHVDPKNHGQMYDTATHLAAKQETIDKWLGELNAPQIRAALQRAYRSGQSIPNASDWYAVGQLEADFIKELGPDAGRKAFRERFAGAMATATAGSDPTGNLLMAHYLNYLRNKGLPYPSSALERAEMIPNPVGGRYAKGNIGAHQRVMDAVARGEDIGFVLDQNNPKRLDFMQAFLGYKPSFVWDEQMTAAATEGAYQMPPVGTYGIFEDIGRQEAARAKVGGQNFQDVAWAGIKKLLAELRGEPFSYEGPMIQHINDAIERTHRLTGMARDEIVRRGLIKGEIPLYGGAGLAAGATLSSPSKDQAPQ